MHKYDENERIKQRERLNKIFITLKKRNITKRTIAENYGKDSTYISNLLSGKMGNIPDGFLNFLKDKYYVNPDYVRLESDTPFNYLADKYEAFLKVFKKWTTVEHEGERYLQLTMDSNFYNFLLDVDNIKLFNESGSIDAELEIENLKKFHFCEPEIKNFVVIPCDDALEIVDTMQEKRKHLSSVLDLLNLK